jgi:hypothetical protein
MSTQQERPNLNEIAKMLAGGKITPEQACSLIEEFRDAGGNLDLEEIDAENEQQKGFHEIAWTLADWKITTEEACSVFEEWIDEWQARENLVNSK